MYILSIYVNNLGN